MKSSRRWTSPPEQKNYSIYRICSQTKRITLTKDTLLTSPPFKITFIPNQTCKTFRTSKISIIKRAKSSSIFSINLCKN